MKRLWSLLCIALTLACGPLPAIAEPYEHPYPEALRMSTRTETRRLADGGKIAVDFPVTASESVNQALESAIEALYAQAVAARAEGERVDLMATYRLSGEKWAGFLMTGRTVRLGKSPTASYTTEETVGLWCDVMTYDMETATPLTLADVFAEDSAAWPRVIELAQATLRGYYPGEPRDEAALEQLTSKQALQASPFLPCAGRLLVPIPLYSVMPKHWQIAHVALPYPDFRAEMTAEAFAQTDNSSRPMVAITMDDGPHFSSSQLALRGLARYGATATFFCIGYRMDWWPDLPRRELDYGHTVASHSLTHHSPSKQPKQEMLDEVELIRQKHREVTGVAPILFRPPGGNYKKYLQRQVGWPLILWNQSSSDTGEINQKQIAWRVHSKAKHGNIILMHDCKRKTALAVPLFCKELEKRGYMFATVEELMYLNGVSPQPNTLYYSALEATEPSVSK